MPCCAALGAYAPSSLSALSRENEGLRATSPSPLAISRTHRGVGGANATLEQRAIRCRQSSAVRVSFIDAVARELRPLSILKEAKTLPEELAV
jgi:hypothetical protein